MPFISETELAGIGRRFEIQTRSGESLVIVASESGQVELYAIPKDNPDSTVPIATLNQEEARYVSAIIGGTLYRPEAVEHLAKHGVTVELYKIGRSGDAAGKTLGDFQIGERTGAAVTALIGKQGEQHTNLSPDLVLKDGMRLVLVGTSEELEACKKLLESGQL